MSERHIVGNLMHWLIYRIFKQLAKALIRLRVCEGWSELLLVAHTTLLEISCRGLFTVNNKSHYFSQLDQYKNNLYQVHISKNEGKDHMNI